MKYASKEELDESYASQDRRRKIPEGLSPPAKRMYEKDLARLEGRDDFSFTVSIPDWIPREKSREYMDRLGNMILVATQEIVDEARDRYKPKQGTLETVNTMNGGS